MSALRRAAAGYLALQTGKAALALRTARAAPPAREPAAADVAQVVVAQPVLSGDPELENVLRDNLLSLVGARFVWLVDTDDAEGRAVTARLAEQAAAAGADAPRLEIVLCPPAPEGVNPKLAKLVTALDAAEDDEVLLVLDDDTRLPRPALGALLGGLQQGATLATGLPGYLPGRGPWAGLVQQFVLDNAAMTYLTLPPVTINGMTWAVRVRDLRALGGFTPLLRTLTDDLAVARAVLGSGGTIVQTATPQWTTTTVASPGAYVRLLHRWMLFADLLLRRQPPRTAGAIAGLHGVHPGLLGFVLAGAVRTRRPGPAVVVLGGRTLLLIGVQRAVHGRSHHRPLLSVASELMQPAHLVHAALRRTIRWRSRVYRVRADDDFGPA